MSKCKFNIKGYTAACTNIPGIKAVSVIAKGCVTGFNEGDEINNITYEAESSEASWGKFEIEDNKASLKQSTAFDPKKNVYLNTNTLTFNLNSFQAITDYVNLNSEVYVAVLGNDNTAYLLGLSRRKFDMCNVTGLESNTGAAFTDMIETIVTVTDKTDDKIHTIDKSLFNTIFAGSFETIKPGV